MTDRLSEEAVERIVRRAIELDDTGGDDAIGGLDLTAVVAAAEELGISRDAVLHSVALERLGDEPPRRTLDPLFGARWVVVQRRVGGSAETVFDRLDEWLTRGHHLRREQRDDTTAMWRRRSDMAASLQRGVRGFSGRGRLGTVASITGHITGIDDHTSIVRVAADRSSTRSRHIGVASISGAGGVVTAAGFATVAPPLAAVGVPVVAVAGVAANRSKRAADGLASELSRLLDQLAANESPSSAMGIPLRRRRSRR
ncbi:MAG: hypothetical protein AAGA90_00630 [Actinomycetota bacterium]